MSDTVKQIREAIESRIEALPLLFSKLDNKFDLEKNNLTNESKRYGVIAGAGSNSPGIIRHLTVDRVFSITLCNKFISTMNGDVKQQQVGDILEDQMEAIIIDLSSSNLGLGSTVIEVVYSSNEEINYEEVENLAILRFNIVVKYRKQVTSC